MKVAFLALAAAVVELPHAGLWAHRGPTPTHTPRTPHSEGAAPSSRLWAKPTLRGIPTPVKLQKPAPGPTVADPRWLSTKVAAVAADLAKPVATSTASGSDLAKPVATALPTDPALADGLLGEAALGPRLAPTLAPTVFSARPAVALEDPAMADGMLEPPAPAARLPWHSSSPAYYTAQKQEGPDQILQRLEHITKTLSHMHEQEAPAAHADEPTAATRPAQRLLTPAANIAGPTERPAAKPELTGATASSGSEAPSSRLWAKPKLRGIAPARPARVPADHPQPQGWQPATTQAAVPKQAVPTKAVPTKAVPTKAVPTAPARPARVPVPADHPQPQGWQPVPTQAAVPKQAVPTKAVPTKAVPTAPATSTQATAATAPAAPQPAPSRFWSPPAAREQKAKQAAFGAEQAAATDELAAALAPAVTQAAPSAPAPRPLRQNAPLRPAAARPAATAAARAHPRVHAQAARAAQSASETAAVEKKLAAAYGDADDDWLEAVEKAAGVDSA